MLEDYMGKHFPNFKTTYGTMNFSSIENEKNADLIQNLKYLNEAGSVGAHKKAFDEWMANKRHVYYDAVSAIKTVNIDESAYGLNEFLNEC
jgi:hypothetical protein